MHRSSETADAMASPGGRGDWCRLQEVNRELWLLLSMFVLAAILNFAAGTQRMILGFYSLPTLFSAYMYGRRHAVLTATGSVSIVGLVIYFNPRLLAASSTRLFIDDRWFDLAVWGGILVLTAYAMGTLYALRERSLRELREAYQGILLILQTLISKDKASEDHSVRVSSYAATIAHTLRLDPERIEDVRSAALMNEIVKLDTGRDVLLKAARFARVQGDSKGNIRVGGALPRVLPILLASSHGTSMSHGAGRDPIPMESYIVTVADVYDSLTSDRPYRKAMSPFDAKEVIMRGAGTDFDPTVVKGFVAAFDRRLLDASLVTTSRVVAPTGQYANC